MKKISLIITSDINQWREINQNTLVLGAWCFENVTDLPADYLPGSVPYHWNDRDKLIEDFAFLNEVQSKVIRELSQFLNAFHKVDYSPRFWEILIGPWVGYFVQILFDRWYMLRFTFDNFIVENIIKSNYPGFKAPNDMAAFEELMVSIEWNEILFNCILESFHESIGNGGELETSVIGSQIPIRDESSKSKWKILIKRLLKWHNSKFVNSKVYLNSTYLGNAVDIQLQIKMGQFPHIWRTKTEYEYPFDSSLREWNLNLTSSKHAEFFALLNRLVPKYLPRAYLEGFKKLAQATLENDFPNCPELIITANAYNSDELFKFWAGCMIEKGSKLVIAQHGGGFGISQFSFMESHQILISDYFLSWGWSSPNETKIIPALMIKPLRTPGRRTGTRVILVGVCYPQLSYHLYSVPISAEQWKVYFNEQVRFVQTLIPDIKEVLWIRPYGQDYNYNQIENWQNRIPGPKFDSPANSFMDSISDARVVITTYNSTTFLETIASGIPTIIFWNPYFFEIREEATQYFDELEKVGIFHKSPEAAGRFLSENWTNLEDWWESKEVVFARGLFQNRFCRNVSNKSLELSRILRKLD